MRLTTTAAPEILDDRPASASRFDRLVATYREDHTHPVNHVLHVFVGWPMVGLALLLLPLGLWRWSLGLFLGGYAFMWAGHFLFEGNIPTILKHPTTPFVMAWAVIRQLAGGFVRLASRRRSA